MRVCKKKCKSWLVAQHERERLRCLAGFLFLRVALERGIMGWEGGSCGCGKLRGATARLGVAVVRGAART